MDNKQKKKQDGKRVNISQYYELHYLEKISKKWIVDLDKDIVAVKECKQDSRSLKQLRRIVKFANKAAKKLMKDAK